MNQTNDNKILKRVGCFGIPLIVIVIGAVIGLRRWDYPLASRELDKEWARAQKNGIPLTKDDLNPNPPIADGQNAAIEYRRIADALSKAEPARSTQSTSNSADVGAENFAKVEPFLERVIAASKKSTYWAPRDYDLSSELSFLELSTYRSFAKALAFRAEKRVRAGDINGAIADLQTGFRMANHLGHEQILIGYLVGLSVYSIEIGAVERMADGISDRPDWIKQLRLCIEASTPPNDIRPALKGEIYFELATLRNLKRYGGTWKFIKSLQSSEDSLSTDSEQDKVDNGIPLQRSGKPKGMVARALTARILAYWNDVIESPAWQKGDLKELGPLMDRLATEQSFKRTHKSSYKVNDAVLPVFFQVGFAAMKAEARKQTTRSLLLVLEYRAKNGAFPVSLKEAGAEADDPFIKGSSLHYKADGKSAKVWSVGENLKDDGGESEEFKDIVSEYPIRKRE
jgi:hypothetical protein